MPSRPLLTRASRNTSSGTEALPCRIVTPAYKHILHVENGFLPLRQKSGTFRLEFEKIKTGKLLTPASPADPPAPTTRSQARMSGNTQVCRFLAVISCRCSPYHGLSLALRELHCLHNRHASLEEEEEEESFAVFFSRHSVFSLAFIGKNTLPDHCQDNSRRCYCLL